MTKIPPLSSYGSRATCMHLILTPLSTGGCSGGLDVSANAVRVYGILGRVRHGRQGFTSGLQARVRRGVRVVVAWIVVGSWFPILLHQVGATLHVSVFGRPLLSLLCCDHAATSRRPCTLMCVTTISLGGMMARTLRYSPPQSCLITGLSCPLPVFALPGLCMTRSWVLLRNTHLCPEWLGELEKKLRGLALHPSFRLFLTSEVRST